MSEIDEILNSKFFKDEILDIEEENKELKESGWSRKDINQMAIFLKKNIKK